MITIPDTDFTAYLVCHRWAEQHLEAIERYRFQASLKQWYFDVCASSMTYNITSKPWGVRKLREQVKFTPPNGDPYFSGICKLKGTGRKNEYHCSITCPKLKANLGAGYSCDLNMMIAVD